jgi:hypothetical protein
MTKNCSKLSQGVYTLKKVKAIHKKVTPSRTFQFILKAIKIEAIITN